MKAFKDYDTTETYGEFQALPKGGYVLKILGVSEETASNGNKYFKISCDICEGEYIDYFLKRWQANKNEDKKWGCNLTLWEPLDDGSEKDGWTKRSFKTAIVAIEDSNAGYHWNWDEKTLKGKLVGGLFNQREYKKANGEYAMATNLARFCAVDLIRSGEYKLPDDRFMTNKAAAAEPNDGFMAIPDDVSDEGLPFS